MDLAHTISAMIGDRVVRVHCKTCKSDHNYRPPKGVKEPGQIPPALRGRGESSRSNTGDPKAAKAAAIPVEVLWEAKIREARSKPLQTYTASAKFQVGDRLVHPTFGEGVVQRLIYPNKAEVIFQMDIKTLIHKP
jgi:hypothetical protein